MTAPAEAPAHLALARLLAMLALQTDYAVHRSITRAEPLDGILTRFTEWPFYHDSFLATCAPADNEEWTRCVRDAVAALPSRGAPSDVFEHLRRALLPEMHARIEAAHRQAEGHVRGGLAGFRYEYHPEYFGPPQPDLVTLHFCNAFVPDSPFEHGKELRAGLREIVRLARTDRPDVARAQCATWLNHVERFTRLFPSEWDCSGTDCPLEGHTGWWGQFTDRTGGLHQARAAAFRATWRFRYPNRHCRCSLDALEAHLER